MAKFKEVPFEVQIKFLLRGREKGVRDLKLRAVLLDSVSDASLRGENIKVVKVTVNRSNNGRVHGLHNHKQAKGAVMYSDINNPQDVKDIVKAAAKHGALAVFVCCDPGLPLTIPIFVVDQKLIREMREDAQLRMEASFHSVRDADDSSELSLVESEVLNSPLRNDLGDYFEVEFNISMVVGTRMDGNLKTLNFVKKSFLPQGKDPSAFSCQNKELGRVAYAAGEFTNKSRLKKELVLHYSGTDEDAIPILARESVDIGAFGLFVKIQPTAAMNIPVFYFDDNEFREILEYSTVSVSIVPSTVSEETRKQVTNDGLECIQNTSGSRNVDISNKALSYADVASSGTQESRVKKSKESENSSWWQKGTTWVKNVIYTPKVRQDLQAILRSKRDWSIEGDHGSYNTAMKMITVAESSHEHYEQEFKEIYVQVSQYLEQHSDKIDIVMLGFVAHFLQHYRFEQRDMKALRLKVVNCLSNLEISSSVTKLCDMGLKVGVNLHPSKSLLLFIHGHLKLMQEENEKLNFDDIFIVKFLWVHTYHCGQTFDWKLLTSLIKLEDSSHQTSRNLAQVVGEVSFRSLVLATQQTKWSFYQVLKDFYFMDGEPIQVETHLTTKICGWLHVRQSDDEWIAVVQALDHLCLQNETLMYEWRRRVSSLIVEHWGGKDFAKLQYIWDSVDVEHSCKKLFRQAITRSLVSNVQHSPQISSLREAICLPFVGELLGSKDLFGSLEAFIQLRVKGLHREIQNKIGLIEDVYINHMRVQDVDSNTATALFQHSIEELLKTNGAWKEFIRTASSRENLFSSSSIDDSIVRAIAVLVVEKGSITRNIKVLQTLPLSDSGRVMIQISSVISKTLCGFYDDVSKATEFYRVTTVEANGALDRIRHDVLLNALGKWNPENLFNIISLSTYTLKVIDSCSSQMKESNDKAMNARSKISSLVELWRQQLLQGSVTYDEVKNILSLYIHEKWVAIESITGAKFADDEMLNDALLSFDESIEVIMSSSHIDTGEKGLDQNQHILKMLAKYGCGDTRDEGIASIFLKWKDHTSTQINSFKKSYLLAEIQKDAKALKQFRGDFRSEISIAQFMGGSDCMLFYKQIGFGEYDTISIEQFLSRVSEAKQELFTFLKCNGNEPYLAVKERHTLLARDGRELKIDVDLLLSCPYFDLSDDDISTFRSISLIVFLSSPLKGFISCCEQLKFAFVHGDESFKALRKISNSLDLDGDDAIRVGGGAEEVVSMLVDLLSPEVRDDEVIHAEFLEALVPFFISIGHLSTSSESWTLVREMNWFGQEGLRQFYEEFSNVTNKFLFADAETYESSVLDSLEPIVRVLSYIGAHVNESSFHNFCTYAQDRSEFNANNFLDTKRNLQLVQENVSNIREWFDSGADEMSEIFSKFGHVWKSGQFFISENRLCLKYTSGDSRDQITSSGLHKFIQQLGFVQQENQEMAGQITSVIDQYQLLLDIVAIRVQASSLGFDAADLGSFVFSVNQGLESARGLLDEAIQMLRECQIWLKKIRSKAPLSLLFWTEDLRKVYDTIALLSNSYDTDQLDILLPKLSVLIPPKIFASDRDNIIKVAHESFEQLKDNFDGGNDSCWLQVVSSSLESFHKQIGQPRYSKMSQNAKGGIFLHSFDCSEERKAQMTLGVMQYIYKGRLPESFEVFDGQMVCTPHKIETFLQRVLAFPTSTFTIMNVQDLCVELQEILVEFISKPQAAQRICNLNFIQRSDTILHSSPWVEQIVWNRRKMHLFDLSDLKSSIADFIESVNLVVGPSGSGKTEKIRHQIKQMKCKSVSLPLHEGTTIQSLMKILRGIESHENCKVVIHFSFMISLTNCNSGWLKSMNNFFNSLLLTRSIHDPIGGETLYIGWQNWSIFFELQGLKVDIESLNGSNIVEEALVDTIPILFYSSTACVMPSKDYAIDEQAHRVCTYLRAYKDGTIDRKFDPSSGKKQLMFVIDISGSMNGAKIHSAIDNALLIFDSHLQLGDVFGTILFDHTTITHIPLQEVTVGNKMQLRASLDGCRIAEGGTSMFYALYEAILYLQQSKNSYDSWIVCLTDGVSDDRSRQECRQVLCHSPPSLHLTIVGIDLHEDYGEYLKNMCGKFDCQETKGIFIPSGSTEHALRNAFATVAASIPVSQTFELDGILSSNDCLKLMREYLPDSVADHDMLCKKFWVEFLHRRVKVFDENEHFNYNEVHDNLGSSLMKIMLDEASRLLSTEQNSNWKKSNHEQLIYDFSDSDAPEFRLMCTAPDLMTKDSIQRYESFDLPGFFIPTLQQLQNRNLLDLFLSQALSVPLTTDSAGNGYLQCIDENGFVLTLDFVMKLLNMHERVACHIPCIIEGETGVSKTALTLMYSILMNSSLVEQSRKETLNVLTSVEKTLANEGFLSIPADDERNSFERLHAAIVDATDGTRTRSTDMGSRLLHLLLHHNQQRSSIFKNSPISFRDCNDGNDTSAVLCSLQWFAEASLERTFFELNVDASLDETEIISFFDDVCEKAQKVAPSGAMVVVFLDEINTSSVMGLFKEVVVDRTYSGKILESNVTIVAACNPAGRQSLSSGASRESDLAREWASGHYQVNKLPTSMERLKWNYGALNPEQEKEFVLRRIEMLDEDIPIYLAAELTELIATSQEAIRSFAKEDIQKGLVRLSYKGSISIEEEARNRARSTVSLRDIQRVFTVFDFFVAEFPLTCGRMQSQYRDSMLLTIAVVYFFKLDSVSRCLFLQKLSEETMNPDFEHEFISLLGDRMTRIVEETNIPDGIAITDGLKENIFMSLVCSLSCTPLVIIGPPGSSKTLSINILDDNTNGEESPSEFYRKVSRLSTYHYQCSRTSTSKEVASVFDKAIQRQIKVDADKHRCLVFMDEAGLPEESKESLKVLHYYLEGHMSAKAKVGFVAITNHVLDAAKSNRCVSLLRQEPGQGEMSQVTEGVLYSSFEGQGNIEAVKCGENLLQKKRFAYLLSAAYKNVLEMKDGEFNTFYGLRDFIYFLRSLRRNCLVVEMTLLVSRESVIRALERNFNGISCADVEVLIASFLLHCEMNDDTSGLLQMPMHIIRSALHEIVPNTRYTMIIDESDDDSIMRLLQSEGIICTSKRNLFKLSNMSNNSEMEELSLVSRVKFAAQQGSNTIVLSQTDKVNESFYDLFNQHFRKVPSRDGSSERLYANIAVGGISRRSLISETFRCVMHVRVIDLPTIPAPFLNRFEKYRLSVAELLATKVKYSPFLSRIITRCCARISAFSSMVTLIGFVPGQTTETLLLNLFENAKILQKDDTMKNQTLSGNTFSEYFISFAKVGIGIIVTQDEFTRIIDYGKAFLPLSLSCVLQDIVTKQKLDYPGKVNEAIQRCLYGYPEDDIALLIDRLFEMVLTRKVILSLLQLASPEEIFKKRSCLPSNLMSEYFKQEHFSLKPFLSSIEESSLEPDEKRQQKYIIHTRTNGQVMGIPTVRSGMDLSPVIQKLVHIDSNNVIIEHLSSVKNESSLRSTIDNWCEDDAIGLLLLVVDMSDKVSTERLNYVRCCVDQAHKEKKTFVAILHYPTSAFLAKKFYPSLFIGNWSHVYLDSIGDGGISSNMKSLVEKTCRSDKCDTFNIGDMVAQVMKEAIKSVASYDVIYPEQLPQQMNRSKSFHVRHDYLMEVLSIGINEGKSIIDVLSERFTSLWSDKNLASILGRAAWSLQNGTSQLGLTSCLKGILQDTMATFLLSSLSLLNEWKNLDVLSKQYRDNESDYLFYMVFTSLPMMPFEELLLHQAGSLSKCKDLPKGRHLAVQFPFFSLFSSLLDEVVETTLQGLSASNDESTFPISTAEFLDDAMNLLRTKTLEEKSTIAYTTFEHVSRSKLLCNRYLEQFLEWKICCPQISTIAEWFRNKLYVESNQVRQSLSHGNLLLIHIIARKYDMQLARMSCFGDDIPPWINQDVDTTTFDSLKLLESSTSWFSANLIDLLKGDLSCKWTNFFTEYNMNSILGDEVVTDSNIFLCLRLLAFFSSLLSTSEDSLALSDDSIEKCIDIFYDRINSKFYVEVQSNLKYLFKVIDQLDESEECRERCCKDLLRQFFSPQWLVNIELDWYEDFTFMITYLTSKSESKCNEKLLFELLRNACIYGTVLEVKQKGSSNLVEDKILGLSKSRLLAVDSILSCSDLSAFSDSGSREKIPHFVPNFAKSQHSHCTSNISQTSTMEELNTFFMDYRNSFSGTAMLAEAVFQLILQRLIVLSNEQSSEKLLLALVKGIQIECNLSRHDQTRLRRTRSAQVEEKNVGESIHVGSKLAVMIVESRLICYMFRVSYEVASDLPVSAIEGIYSQLGKTVLHNMMSLPNTRWQEIFMLNIVKIAGEGKLLQLLGSTDSTLNDLVWTNDWRAGLPSKKNGVEEKLRVAEEILREAENEEYRKSQEIRLCPNCRRPFLVQQQNCGQFICGRYDFHTTPVDDAYGCGNEFNLALAPYYNSDQSILAPLQEAVEVERQKLVQHNILSGIWERMREGEVPYLSSAILKDNSHYSPQSIATITIGKDLDIFRHLIESREKVKTFQMLPQLIELYIWLQSTFHSILSHEQAQAITMQDLMQHEHLSKRFDPVHVEHLAVLWDGLKENLNSHLTNCDCKVNWDCETVSIPFEKIEDANLIMLLSAYEHPTGGCDFLFIIITQIIGQFNDFMQKVCECHPGAESRPVEPKDLLTRSPAALSLEALNFVSSPSFAILLENFRMPYKDQYDIASLELTIRKALVGCKFHIQNPMGKLRSQFQFRRDTATYSVDRNEKVALQSSAGTYFVHPQDLQLFENCKDLIKKQNLRTSSTSLRHTFMAKFQNLDYEKLRAVLEGTKNALCTFAFSSDQSFSSYLPTEDNLKQLGFPLLSDSQTQLLCTTTEVAELVEYVGYQLASEAYHFSTLPLSMNSDMTTAQRCELRKNIESLYNENGKRYVFTALREFSTDVLSLYQQQIREHCKSSNDTIREFLEVKNPFCDDSDPIFAALPESITVRNFIPLHQELHQLTLRLMSKEGISEDSDEPLTIERYPEFANPRRGNSWILHEEESNDALEEDDILVDSSDTDKNTDNGVLWFQSASKYSAAIPSTSDPNNSNDNETCITHASDPADELLDKSSDTKQIERQVLHTETDLEGGQEVDDNSIDNEMPVALKDAAATMIQKWWKSRRSQKLDETKDDQVEEINLTVEMQRSHSEQKSIDLPNLHPTFTEAVGAIALVLFLSGESLSLTIFGQIFTLKLPISRQSQKSIPCIPLMLILLAVKLILLTMKRCKTRNKGS